uniref:Uncharacterized protein n=1 Tax=Amphimedon queenslandica TaxID=400682 RepID=A0A1X7VFL5_AMPQE
MHEVPGLNPTLGQSFILIFLRSKCHFRKWKPGLLFKEIQYVVHVHVYV